MSQRLHVPRQVAFAGAIVAMLVIAGVSLTSEVASARSVLRTTPGILNQSSSEGPIHCWDLSYTFDVNANTNSVKIWAYESDGVNGWKTSEEIRNVSPSSSGHSYYKKLGGNGWTSVIFTHAFTGSNATGDSATSQKQFVTVADYGCPSDGSR